MIKFLEINNFKSIKYLKLPCKKINIFIGKPNTGKSNILEGIGIFSLPYTGNIREDVSMRFTNFTNLFYDNDFANTIKIVTDYIELSIKKVTENFKGRCIEKKTKLQGELFNFVADYQGINSFSKNTSLNFNLFKFYRFKAMDIFPERDTDFLLPIKGENLLQILLVNKSLKKVAADIFGEYGLKIVLKPHEDKIEIQKQIEEDVVVSYPYFLVSDTLQRIVFHLAAIETNKNSAIIFEEPEAHAFPYYTKFLAERISFDETNQYFISTHNPYFLLSILEKSAKNDIGVFITYFEDYQTKVKELNEKEKCEIFDLSADVFFNLDKFLEKR